MATPLQAYRNIRKYGFRRAIKGAKETPGGYLDNTPSNPNVSLTISRGVHPNSRSAGEKYYDPATGTYMSYPLIGAQQIGPTRPEQVAGESEPGYDLASILAELTGSGSVSGSGSTESNIVYFNGTAYDLSNPSQADAYYAAQRDAYISEAQSNVRSALEEASRSYGQDLTGLTRDIDELGRSQTEYGKASAGQITGLGQGYDSGTVRRGQYFSGLSPRAYQSSQGSSQLFAQGKLQQGIGDVTSALEEANRQFNLQRQSLGEERSNMERGYNEYTKGQQDYLTRAQQAAEDYYNTQGANAFNVSGPGAYSYSRNQFNPYKAQSVDLKAYTPFTEFNNLPGAGAGSQPGQGYTGSYKPGEGYGGLSQFLGYEPDEKERGLLDRYLKLGY